MVDTLIGIDTEFLLWVNSFHSLFWDVFMKMATGRIIWLGLYLSMIYALWRSYGYKSMLIITFLCIIAVACSDQLTASIMRPYFERLRPANLDSPISSIVHIVDGYRGGRYGFPSSHAANTFTVVTFLIPVFKKWQFSTLILIWAFLNCYSRLYLGVHYPGDILVGMIVGVCMGTFFYCLLLLFKSYIFPTLKFGNRAHINSMIIFDKKVIYQPVDMVILVFLITITAIFFCSISLLW